jgi:D-beta-D-heptose 7-phosphate kinase/D-beta-D-heptose 1-phosphate adenosyltransferase
MNKQQIRFSHIVRGFQGRRVAVLGDYMLDEFLRGEVIRISPEAPVPVVLIQDPNPGTDYPGGAGNVAANIASLGGRPIPYGVVGNDRSGKRLRALLESWHIPAGTLVSERRRITPHKVRIAAHAHQLLRLDFERPETIANRTAEKLARNFALQARGLEALIISDYRKGTVTTELCNHLKVLARQRRIPVFVDPKPEQPEICRHATVVAPNLHEAELMAHATLRNRRDLETGGQRLRAELDCSCLLITRGSEGMVLFEPNKAGQEIKSLPRPVYDVTGAGDTVLATLALAFISGASMREAAELANLAASRVVLKFGTAQIAQEELLRAVATEFNELSED